MQKIRIRSGPIEPLLHVIQPKQFFQFRIQHYKCPSTVVSCDNCHVAPTILAQITAIFNREEMINNPLLALGFEPMAFQLVSLSPPYRDLNVSQETIFPINNQIDLWGLLLVPKRVYVQLSSCSTASLTVLSYQYHLVY